MADYTDGLLSLVFWVTALVVALFLLLLGPLGWFVGAFLILGAKVISSLGQGEDGPSSGGTCSACGAPVDAETTNCGYCGDPVSGDPEAAT